MVLTHSTSHTYSHPFPTVTLAFFLRYCSPRLNPFATHVLSTDTISSHVDPKTNRLHTTRLHLKKSRMPAAVYKLLPASVTGGGTSGEKVAYVLETSVVDIKEGWMRSESKNLNFSGVLSVTEQQEFLVPTDNASLETNVNTSLVFSIESLASTKTKDQLGKSRDGMRHVLERIRNTGVIDILEAIRRERQLGKA
ncbi:unnamed protein product [Clonostachys rosea f. rosea IK726]|uniref:Uncharacterized protein n=1 Tax=Clonostachys rosea f. rosea IK726 TaxID=1349383 RepID=A0ACA9T8V0_BIOOC|nr:unnamed protein product [Clonostachys rosea f. rosea IK726]